MTRLACLLHVSDRNGNPLAGIRIVVEQATSAVPEMAYVTNASGEARIGLPPGQVVLRFFRPSGRSESVTLLIEDSPDRTCSVTLDDDGG